MALCAMGSVASASLSAQRTAGSRHAWWSDAAIQRALGLSPFQVTQLATIFNRDLPARRAVNDNIRRLDAQLIRVIGDEDDAAAMRVSAQLDALRRQQNTRRSLMLLEMYRTLTPAQRRKLARLSPTGQTHR